MFYTRCYNQYGKIKINYIKSTKQKLFKIKK